MFQNIRVRNKLIGGFLFVALLCCVIGAVGMVSIKAITERSDGLYNNQVQGMRLMSDVFSRFQLIRVKLRDIVL
ncbi:MAG: Four helix bundle sensory module for signal transduction, partial [Fibrobacterota bacterium]